MISFPNAKINIGLNITEKRADGYHNLESCFFPIGWSDILEVIPSKSLLFSSSGVPIPGNELGNLCLKAYNLLKKAHNISPVQMHLHKIIPIGAGLGGGSSDGAFTLKMLNEIFDLNLSIKELEVYASQLGSDCPFFIRNKPKYVTGTGNVFHEMDINLSGKHLVIFKPEAHISTAEAYGGIIPKKTSQNIKNILEAKPMSSWKNILVNDFEESILVNHPQIVEIKEMLYAQGAIYASMTGSGAAVYGLFDKKIDLSASNLSSWQSVL